MISHGILHARTFSASSKKSSLWVKCLIFYALYRNQCRISRCSKRKSLFEATTTTINLEPRVKNYHLLTRQIHHHSAAAVGCRRMSGVRSRSLCFSPPEKCVRYHQTIFNRIVLDLVALRETGSLSSPPKTAVQYHTQQ